MECLLVGLVLCKYWIFIGLFSFSFWQIRWYDENKNIAYAKINIPLSLSKHSKKVSKIKHRHFKVLFSFIFSLYNFVFFLFFFRFPMLVRWNYLNRFNMNFNISICFNCNFVCFTRGKKHILLRDLWSVLKKIALINH